MKKAAKSGGRGRAKRNPHAGYSVDLTKLLKWLDGMSRAATRDAASCARGAHYADAAIHSGEVDAYDYAHGILHDLANGLPMYTELGGALLVGGKPAGEEP